MKFEFYVLNFNRAKGVPEMFNIFNNVLVSEQVEKEVRKYLKNPDKYQGEMQHKDTKLRGFPALCEEIRATIQWQEWGRIEYEISVGMPFERDPDKLHKIDCYMQACANIEAITREVIHQAKEQMRHGQKLPS